MRVGPEVILSMAALVIMTAVPGIAAYLKRNKLK